MGMNGEEETTEWACIFLCVQLPHSYRECGQHSEYLGPQEKEVYLYHTCTQQLGLPHQVPRYL